MTAAGDGDDAGEGQGAAAEALGYIVIHNPAISFGRRQRLTSCCGCPRLKWRLRLRLGSKIVTLIVFVLGLSWRGRRWDRDGRN